MTLAFLPNNLAAIRAKVRKVTARPSANQITDQEIDAYINTFYVYDMPEHLRLESLRYTFEFNTQPNIPVYDFPTGSYLTIMPAVFMAGYQSYMTQSRQNFFRINPELNFLQSNVYTGSGSSSTVYTGQNLINTPIIPGFKPNPPGAFAPNADNLLPAKYINWNVIVYAEGSPNSTSGFSTSYVLIDDGLGHLVDQNDPGFAMPSNGHGFTYCGTINYITGAITISQWAYNSTSIAIPAGNPINVQYIPYVPSRPQTCMFFQDQIILYPVPDQSYTITFECYKYPTAFAAADMTGVSTPQLNEWWQLLAYGAADKIFADNGDFENLGKFRPLLKEQMDLMQRRTIVQYTPERVQTIYTEQYEGSQQYPFGNLFSGF